MSDRPERTMYPMSEFRDRGFLWLFNRVVMHPRGFALAFDYPTDDDGQMIPGSDPQGWCIMGDGTEIWQMGMDEAEENAYFEAVEEVFAVAEEENNA